MVTDTGLFTKCLNDAFKNSGIKTKAEFASLLDISPQYLNKILKGEGKSLPPADLVYRMSKVLKISFIKLITGNQDLPIKTNEEEGDPLPGTDDKDFSPSTLAERLQKRMQEEHMTAKELATKTGLSNGAISLILNGKSTDIKFNSALNIAKALHCDVIELMTGTKTYSIETYDDESEPSSDTVAIEQFDILLAAGSDAPEASYEEVNNSRPVWYHRSFFERIGVNPKYCKRLQVSGDSMAPLIQDGDWVLIDCRPGQRVIDGEIYGFWQAQNGLRVKRVYVPMGGGLIIHSDNPRYEDEHYDDCENLNFMLIGRVLERSGLVV